MGVVAKFTCISKTQTRNWQVEPKFIYAYKFQAVTGNSEENKQFFASTPNGSIEIHAVREDLFETGKDYYVEFREAE